MDINIDMDMGQFQLYGIVFLLGSFSVATLSDIRRMSAQVEFTEIWAIFAVIFIVIDIIYWRDSNQTYILLKWLLVVIFILLSNSKFGLLFRLAKGDILACAALLVLLPFFLGIMFIILLKFIDVVLRPLLRRSGSGSAYPFMPVVFVTAVLVFMLEWFFLGSFNQTVNLPF